MPTILEQLRAAQRDAGLKAPTHPEEEVIIRGTEVAVLNPAYLALGKPPAEPKPYHAVNVGPPPTGGGYIKIFPPTFRSISELPAEWVAENWTAPSPWCRVEGLPDHPEFEKNLAGVER